MSNAEPTSRQGARPRRRRRRLPRGDAHDRAAPGGLRQPDLSRGATRRWTAFRDYRPDLVLLDLMLPGKDGIDVCKEIRAESGVPIVMLTAKGDTVDVVVGLESGADDYVVKPFKPKELVARIRAGSAASTPHPRGADHRRPQPSTWPVTRSPATATPINLTPLEFDLLVCLARKPWQVFTREVLLEQVWGYRHAADTRLVNVHVQRLRSKVEHDPENPEIVVTVRGVGYKARNRVDRASTRWPPQSPGRPAPRSHLLAALDPGPRGGQHAAALRGRGQHRRLVPAPADPGRPARPPGRRGGRRGRQRDRRGRGPAGRGARHRRSTLAPSARTWSSRSSSAGSPAASRWCWPARSAGPAAGSPTAAHRSPRASTPQRPRSLEQHFDEPAVDRLDLHRRSTPTPTASRDAAGHRGRLPGPAAGRRRHLHALLPLPRSTRSRRPSRS